MSTTTAREQFTENERKIRERRRSKVSPFVFIDLPDLDDTPVEYRIPGFLANESRNVLISAYRKTGKTALVATLANSLVTGSPFLSATCKALDGPLVYVNLELSQAMLRHYFGSLHLRLSRSIKVLDYCGQASKFLLADEDWRLDFARALIDIRAAALVIDPLHPLAAMNGADSNSNDEMRHTLELLGEISRDANLDHLFIVDHTGHAEKNRARGASGKEDWADVLWNIRGQEDEPRTLTATGRGDIGGSVTYNRSIEVVDGIRQPTGPLVTARTANAADAVSPDDELLGHVRDHPGQTASDIAKSLGRNRANISTRLNALAREGRLARHDDRTFSEPF